MEVMMIFYLVYILAICLFGIASYVLTSLGYYTLAKRRGIRKPWLAWIPVANVWIVGSLSDQYRYVTKGKVANKRKVLLGLYIATVALLVIMMIPYIAMIMTVVSSQDLMTDAYAVQLMGQALAVLAVAFAAITVSIVCSVFFYIAVYDVFRSCNPDNAVLFLVLSILLGVVYPFFVFACRNKDLGMPPRTQVEPAAEPLE